eukprot:450365-Rhodomonas_salina.5
MPACEVQGDSVAHREVWHCEIQYTQTRSQYKVYCKGGRLDLISQRLYLLPLAVRHRHYLPPKPLVQIVCNAIPHVSTMWPRAVVAVQYRARSNAFIQCPETWSTLRLKSVSGVGCSASWPYHTLAQYCTPHRTRVSPSTLRNLSTALRTAPYAGSVLLFAVLHFAHHHILSQYRTSRTPYASSAPPYAPQYHDPNTGQCYRTAHSAPKGGILSTSHVRRPLAAYAVSTPPRKSARGHPPAVKSEPGTPKYPRRPYGNFGFMRWIPGGGGGRNLECDGLREDHVDVEHAAEHLCARACEAGLRACARRCAGAEHVHCGTRAQKTQTTCTRLRTRALRCARATAHVFCTAHVHTPACATGGCNGRNGPGTRGGAAA